MSERVSMVREGWAGPGRRDWEIEPLQLKEDGLHMEIGQKGMFEWWYFDAHLDTGQTIVIFFHASNPNPGREGKIGIEFVLINADGQRKQYFIPYSQTDFRADHEYPDVRIGRNSLKVEQRDGELPVYEIYVDEKEFGCHLKYQAEVNGWKPGSGFSHFGDMGYFAWIVPFARAAVEGSIRDGDKMTEVTGTGYHDHNWLNFQFQRIIDYWMWGRIYAESYTAAYAFIQCNDKVDNHAVKVLMLAEGEEVILSTGEFDFLTDAYEYDPRAKHRFPRKVIISSPAELEVSLNVSRVLESEDMLTNFNPLLRFVAKHILRLKPGYFRLVSDFELEVTRGMESKRETGTTLHEIVMFKASD